MTLLEIKRQLRDGQYAWPGGYPKFFITEDGAALSFDTVRKEWRNVVWSHLAAKHNAPNDGWRIAGCDINWEDSELVCDHSGQKIESAYGEN
jgi:hypothetical protein